MAAASSPKAGAFRGKSAKSAPDKSEHVADDTPSNNFCATVGPVLLSAAEQAAISAGKALAQALKGVLTATNITKCLTCTGHKIDDDISNGKQPNCGDNTGGSSPGAPVPAPGKGVSRDKQGQPVPIEEPAEPVKAPEYIDYPGKFDPDVSGPDAAKGTGASQVTVVKTFSSSNTAGSRPLPQPLFV